MGGAESRADRRECRSSLGSGRPVDTMLSELVLAALLLGVVILSAKT